MLGNRTFSLQWLYPKGNELNIEYPPFGNMLYCSRVAGRNPEWKIHRDRGKAINAIMMNFRGGQIWVFDFDIGRWEIEYNAPPKYFSPQKHWPHLVPGHFMEKDDTIGRMRQSKATLELCVNHGVEVLEHRPYGDIEIVTDEEMLRRLI